jgi:hypothetical protein
MGFRASDPVARCCTAARFTVIKRTAATEIMAVVTTTAARVGSLLRGHCPTGQNLR